MAKTAVFVIFDAHNNTWNVMTPNRNCLFFGTADSLDQWLCDNSATHRECTEKELMSQLSHLLKKVRS